MFRFALLLALAGCATTNQTSASYCGSQGSQQAIWQCEQYYASHNVSPPVPQNASASAVDRSALLGALIVNQPRPYYQQPYIMPVQHNRGFSCMQAGNMVSCY